MFNRAKRNWLVMRIPTRRDTKPDSTVWSNAQFDQESSPGWPGGTLARKLLTREDAYAMAERMASNQEDLPYGHLWTYYPVEINDFFYKTFETKGIDQKGSIT